MVRLEYLCYDLFAGASESQHGLETERWNDFPNPLREEMETERKLSQPHIPEFCFQSPDWMLTVEWGERGGGYYLFLKGRMVTSQFRSQILNSINSF